ncbi:MAG: hypothetical protein HYU86_12275 [Chloroflexi bacterium]|nr:hypothetical protein [Chloroflexota bacterium]
MTAGILIQTAHRLYLAAGWVALAGLSLHALLIFSYGAHFLMVTAGLALALGLISHLVGGATSTLSPHYHRMITHETTALQPHHRGGS